ncbi:MAG TPA: nuclear transport factor 2 family protein [Gaiellaceae bacterium]|nr:nuclear transport factor 2 family protein [Gaiellaceae bacterium]
MDTGAAVRAWVDAWSRAWPAADPAPLAAVYAPDADFRSHPFREPHEGREGALDYARTAFDDQEGFTYCRFGELVVAGDRAAVEYWAVLVENGREVTIAGISLLRFGPDGLVRSQRDYWALEPGARDPAAGWGT